MRNLFFSLFIVLFITSTAFAGIYGFSFNDTYVTNFEGATFSLTGWSGCCNYKDKNLKVIFTDETNNAYISIPYSKAKGFSNNFDICGITCKLENNEIILVDYGIIFTKTEPIISDFISVSIDGFSHGVINSCNHTYTRMIVENLGTSESPMYVTYPDMNYNHYHSPYSCSDEEFIKLNIIIKNKTSKILSKISFTISLFDENNNLIKKITEENYSLYANQKIIQPYTTEKFMYSTNEYITPNSIDYNKIKQIKVKITNCCFRGHGYDIPIK